LDLGAVDAGGSAVGADRHVGDDAEAHRAPPRGVWAAMSWARCPASRACWVIQVSAQCLWQGTSLTGDRHKAGLPQHTHGATGPVAACVQSRMTGPGTTLVAWDMPRSPVLLRGRGTVLAGRAGGWQSSRPGTALSGGRFGRDDGGGLTGHAVGGERHPAEAGRGAVF